MAAEDTPVPQLAQAPGPEVHAPPAPLRTGIGLLLPVLVIVALLLLLLGGTAGGLRWMLWTEPGSAWLLKRLSAVQLEGFRGSLLGPSWQADRLRVEWDGGRQWLLVEDMKGEGLAWTWRPNPEAWVALAVKSLSARAVTLQTGPPTDGPRTMPETLSPPVQLSLGQFHTRSFVLDQHAPLRELRLSGLEIDPRAGQQHRVQAFAVQVDEVTVSGAAALTNAPPYALSAQASAAPSGSGDAPAWAAVLKATGSVAELSLDATLRGRAPAPGRAAPALDLHAGLRPLQKWLLVRLDLKTQALDLSALAARAPATQLSGQATLQGGDKGTPVLAQLALDNAMPGRWNERRLPLRRIALDLSGLPGQRQRVQLKRFDLLLADASGGAGRWTGSGVWEGHALNLDTQLHELNPQRLDGRAAAMTVSGPLSLQLRGLPAPDFAASAAPPPSVAWKLDLQGRLARAAQPVRLQLEGSADDQRLELRRALAESGTASAQLTATLVRGARGDWVLDSSGKVSEFDPLPWWPGDEGSPWRKGPHRFSGDWQFALRLPRQAEQMDPLLLAQRLAGNGTLRLQRSMLAGVPLAADLSLGYSPAAAPTPAVLRADVQVGGNQLRVEGRGDPGGSGSGDRVRIELDAPALAALAPLARLHPATAAWAPGAGSARLEIAADGRWPDVRTQGTATVSQLKAGPLSLARGSTQWQMASGGEQPLEAQLDLAGLAWHEQRADHLRADVRGTLAEHHIEVSAAMPLKPPRQFEQLLGVSVQSGTRALLQAGGRWLPAAAGGGQWQARIEHLAVGSWDGSDASGPPASGWAELSDLRAQLDFDGRGRLLALQAAPGRVRLGASVVMRWDEVRLDRRGPETLLWLRADVEPFTLAPLLARLQPDMGWQGDLRLRARLDIRAAEKMDADLVFERVDGDLHIAGSEGTQLLGLNALRVAISAHDGLWNFAPSFNGRSIGDLSGEIRVRAAPEQRWPAAASPIEGRVQARVADLGIWGAWVPPGWRLAGALETTATLSGSFGQPLYTGQVEGKGLAVRNLLQGVNISDGQVLVTLAGDTARVERFTFRGGDGNATLSGNATLGARPQARLQLKADKLRVLGRIDRLFIASGHAELVLDADRTTLDGKFRVDEGLYDASRADAPGLDDDVTLRHANETLDRRSNPDTAAPRRSFALGVDIDLGDRVRLRGRGLDTGLRGEVRLSTPAGRLAVHGTISADNGTYAAYGQKLEIERGIVAFSGTPGNPRLDVLALRPNIDQRVGVAITGTLLAPRVRLFAEPELSDSEKLSWLVLGRAPDGLGRNDTALLQRAAVALLAGEGEAPTDALMRNLGIDEVSLRQGEGDVRETVITVGKQLSRRWYLGYERGVNATTGTWQLIYRIAQRFTLRAQSGVDSALDLIWTWRLQETPADAGMRKSKTVPP